MGKMDEITYFEIREIQDKISALKYMADKT
jgi:hypothetical protein